MGTCDYVSYRLRGRWSPLKTNLVRFSGSPPENERDSLNRRYSDSWVILLCISRNKKKVEIEFFRGLESPNKQVVGRACTSG